MRPPCEEIADAQFCECDTVYVRVNLLSKVRRHMQRCVCPACLSVTFHLPCVTVRCVTLFCTVALKGLKYNENGIIQTLFENSGTFVFFVAVFFLAFRERH